jgi:hypothetical protein
MTRDPTLAVRLTNGTHRLNSQVRIIQRCLAKFAFAGMIMDRL